MSRQREEPITQQFSTHVNQHRTARRHTVGRPTPTLQFARLAAYRRAEAANLRGWGACAETVVLERVAAERERAIREDINEALTLDEAAQLTGYSTEHLGRLVRQGKLANVGRKHAPRVWRGDRRVKANPLPNTPAALRLDRSRTSIARAIATAKE